MKNAVKHGERVAPGWLLVASVIGSLAVLVLVVWIPVRGMLGPQAERVGWKLAEISDDGHTIVIAAEHAACGERLEHVELEEDQSAMVITAFVARRGQLPEGWPMGWGCAEGTELAFAAVRLGSALGTRELLGCQVEGRS
ncbi:MAG: hypothetical protein M3O70_19540, partial [Actinomycetota bacterium]|nr:hypothetical protein [Actinomycetota bacterium]